VRRGRRLRAAPRLGVGLGYRPQFRADLFGRRAEVDFLEIVADHYFDAAPEKLAELDLLAAHFPLVLHALDLSLGSAEGLDDAYVDRLARVVERIDPPWLSEHLSFTRAGGIAIGHLAALPHTKAALDVVERNVERLRKRIRTPLLLENVTTVVSAPGAEMSEAEFLTRALERTGCGWLCDVANLHANAVNHGVDVEGGFEDWPWERLVQVHFAGGRWRGGHLVDSHDCATSEPVWTLFARVAARGEINGAILERDENPPPFEELIAELRRARALLTSLSPEQPLKKEVVARSPAGLRREPPPQGEGDAAQELSLLEMQALLAHLFTDAESREAIFRDPRPTIRNFLSALDPAALAQFAHALESKRIADTRKLLPLTARALGDDFAKLLRPIVQGSAPKGRHRDDAAALLQRLRRDPEVAPRWIVDLAAYELGFVVAGGPGPCLLLRRLGWPPRRLAEAAERGEDPGTPKRATALWLRPFKNSALSHYVF
jgi:uncharacterized protein (UPF0276 family)